MKFQKNILMHQNEPSANSPQNARKSFLAMPQTGSWCPEFTKKCRNQTPRKRKCQTINSLVKQTGISQANKQKEMKMANHIFKSVQHPIKEIQIKTTLRQLLTSVRKAIYHQEITQQMMQRMWGKVSSVTLTEHWQKLKLEGIKDKDDLGK